VDACLVKPVRCVKLMETLAAAWSKKHELRSEPPISKSAAGRSRAVLSQHLGQWDGAGDVRVLVVEDNAVNQKVALTMLDKLGIRADVARKWAGGSGDAKARALRYRFHGLPNASHERL